MHRQVPPLHFLQFSINCMIIFPFLFLWNFTNHWGAAESSNKIADFLEQWKRDPEYWNRISTAGLHMRMVISSSQKIMINLLTYVKFSVTLAHFYIILTDTNGRFMQIKSGTWDPFMGFGGTEACKEKIHWMFPSEVLNPKTILPYHHQLQLVNPNNEHLVLQSQWRSYDQYIMDKWLP